MTSARPGRRRPSAPPRALGAVAAALLSSSRYCKGFTSTTHHARHQCTHHAHRHHRQRRPSPSSSSLAMVRAPPGSGYLRHDASDESEASLSHPELTIDDALQISPPAFPDTYEPMLEYPGTMRPGRTPENMPYHDLPGLDISDPDPVPWPHFQEIEWHHKWDPPHEQALAMEEFIEVQGRWASVEDEAEMRVGMRRGVRERREREELGKAGVGGGGGGEPMVIMDDDEEEEGGGTAADVGVGLGEGVEALLRTARERAGAAKDEDEDEDEDEGDDDFLFDLGLGGDDDDDDSGKPASKGKKKTSKTAIKMVEAGDDDEDEDEDDEDSLDDIFSELGLDNDDGDEVEAGDDDEDEDDEDSVDDIFSELGLDNDGDEDEDEGDEDEEEGDFDDYDDEDDMSLDEYTQEDDGGDDDDFDDGGFDYGE